jgi:4-hydroxyproline epimerase
MGTELSRLEERIANTDTGGDYVHSGGLLTGPRNRTQFAKTGWPWGKARGRECILADEFQARPESALYTIGRIEEAKEKVGRGTASVFPREKSLVRKGTAAQSSRHMVQVEVIDSHTGGEPTRVVLAGGPDLGKGNAAEQMEVFRARHDRFRRAVVNEPRGSDVLVGALLTKPHDASCLTGVIFFNNVGYLQMCGHGTIGLVVTLAHQGRIQAGEHRIETPAGIVSAVLHEDGSVSLANVPSYRKARAVQVEVAGLGVVGGDVAWGGNWFFLIERHGQDLNLGNVEALIDYSWRVRGAIHCQGFPEIDHVELFGPPRNPRAQSRNFVLCPGKAYDRSPCGTGTSAKLACLAAEGKLGEGESWIQESIIGSTFTGRYRWVDQASSRIAPTITGTAFITGQTTLIMDENDPYRWGIAG